MSKEVQEMFSDIAETYDKANRILSLKTDTRWRKRAVKEALKNKPNFILDLCAGTLDLSRTLSENAPDADIQACDFSLNMLLNGLEKISDCQNISLVCGDGHHLPFPENRFDTIICGFGIRNLEEREKAALEIFRTLKPGGRLVVLEFFRPTSPLAKIFYKTYGKKVLPKMGGWISKNEAAYQYLFDTISNWLSIQEYQDLLKKVGFEIASVRSLSGGIAHLLVGEKK